MPVLSGAVTLARFKVTGAKQDPKRWLLRGLAKKPFERLEPKKAEADRAAGFVELEDNDATSFETGSVFQGEHALFAWRIDTIRVPSSAVKAELEKWSIAFEGEQKRKPTKGEKRFRKDEIRVLLRQRAQPNSKVFDVSWRLDEGEVAVWASSRKVIDEIAVAMEEVFGVSMGPVSVGAAAVRADLPENVLGPTPELFGNIGTGASISPPRPAKRGEGRGEGNVAEGGR